MPSVESAGTALFLKRWLRRPLAMGAVMPSGRLLAAAMAKTTKAVLEGRPGHVVELGAGTGEVTKALLAAGIVGGVFEALPRGGALVQFTYGPTPPVPRALRERLHLDGAHGKRIWRNVPPAVVWTFRWPSTA